MRAAVYGIAAAQTQHAILPHRLFIWTPISDQVTEKDVVKLSDPSITRAFRRCIVDISEPTVLAGRGRVMRSPLAALPAESLVTPKPSAMAAGNIG